MSNNTYPPPPFLDPWHTLLEMINIVFKKMSRNYFDIKGHCELDIYVLIPKSTEFILWGESEKGLSVYK